MFLELYDLFAEGREVEDVFEYVPQEPYTPVKEVLNLRIELLSLAACCATEN